MESGQVDCISFGNNSISVSMYILVIPVRIKTKGRIFGLFGTDFSAMPKSQQFSISCLSVLGGQSGLERRAQTNHSRYSHQSGFNNAVKIHSFLSNHLIFVVCIQVIKVACL